MMSSKENDEWEEEVSSALFLVMLNTKKRIKKGTNTSCRLYLARISSDVLSSNQR